MVNSTPTGNIMPGLTIENERTKDRVIHKYEIRAENFSMFLAKDSKVLDISMQEGSLYMWVERPADTQVSSEGRSFEVFVTGEVMPFRKREFIKTLHISESYVLHFYEAL